MYVDREPEDETQTQTEANVSVAKSSSGLSAGPIVGIVFGCIGFLAVILLITLACLHPMVRKQTKKCCQGTIGCFRKCYMRIKKGLSCKDICLKLRKSKKVKKAPTDTPANDKTGDDQEAQAKNTIDHLSKSITDIHKNLYSANTNDHTSNYKSSDDQSSNPVNDDKVKDTELSIEVNGVHIESDND